MTIVDRRYSVAEGTAVKAPCRVATTANIALTGLQSIDGVTVVENDRVLVKDQSTAADNGIYSASSGNWLRTRDFDGAYDIVQGTRIFVTAGSTLAGNEYYVSTSGTITVGSTSIAFTQMPASGIAASVAAATAAAATASAAATSATASAALLGNSAHNYDTRAAAIAATIPVGVNFVRTLAYDSDYTENSGATFKRVPAGTAFSDTWPTAGTIVGGSAYTDGTYYGISLSGSATGSGLYATITISGNAVTAVDYYAMPGNSFKIGDVLTCGNTNIGGTGSGFTYTITTISTPLASFVNTTDSSRWQYLPSKGVIHVNEFGAKADWIGVDATSTNNFTAIQAALFFSVNKNFGTVNFDGGGFAGNIVKCGTGSYMINHTSTGISLIIPNGVYLEGMSGGSTLKIHDGWFAATNCICIGNPNARFANFRCGIRYMELFFSRGIAAALGTYMVYSNNAQDGGGMEHVYIYTGQRGGIRYEVGYGGASVVHFHNLSINCEGPTPAFHGTVGTTIVDCRNWSINAPSSGTNDTVDAIVLTGTGGMYSFDGLHMEGFPNGFNIALAAGNNPMASFKNITGGLDLDYVFTLDSTNDPGNCSFERCQVNNGLALGLVLNGQPSGSSRLTNIEPKDGIVFFNP
jgi:hypothetical protein